jgi:hypothetical protein
MNTQFNNAFAYWLAVSSFQLLFAVVEFEYVLEQFYLEYYLAIL